MYSPVIFFGSIPLKVHVPKKLPLWTFWGSTYAPYREVPKLLFFNPSTPVPAITGRAKTRPQIPEPAVTGCEKACEDNCLSYPHWRFFGSPIVLLLLRTNKPIRINLLSIFLEDFRGPRQMVFRLKITHLKGAVIMVRCRLNLQTSRVLFLFLKRSNYFFGT